MKAAVLAPEPTTNRQQFSWVKALQSPSPKSAHMSPNRSRRCIFLEKANVTHSYPKSAHGQQDVLALARTSTLPFLGPGQYPSDTALPCLNACNQISLCTVLKLSRPAGWRPYYRATWDLRGQQMYPTKKRSYRAMQPLCWCGDTAWNAAAVLFVFEQASLDL